jgi:hypothetical protein
MKTTDRKQMRDSGSFERDSGPLIESTSITREKAPEDRLIIEADAAAGRHAIDASTKPRANP